MLQCRSASLKDLHYTWQRSKARLLSITLLNQLTSDYRWLALKINKGDEARWHQEVTRSSLERPAGMRGRAKRGRKRNGAGRSTVAVAVAGVLTVLRMPAAATAPVTPWLANESTCTSKGRVTTEMQATNFEFQDQRIKSRCPPNQSSTLWSACGVRPCLL